MDVCSWFLALSKSEKIGVVAVIVAVLGIVITTIVSIVLSRKNRVASIQTIEGDATKSVQSSGDNSTINIS